MKVILSVLVSVIGCNLYLIGLLIYLFTRKPRKRNKDGVMIWEDGTLYIPRK